MKESVRIEDAATADGDYCGVGTGGAFLQAWSGGETKFRKSRPIGITYIYLQVQGCYGVILFQHAPLVMYGLRGCLVVDTDERAS